jgi:hypothetical protein
MKLTWFGGTTLRVHMGGRILVFDPAGINGVDEAELVSGADRVVRRDELLPSVDALQWVPRRAAALVDEVKAPEALVHRIGAGALLAEAVGEPPLVLATGPSGRAGRWGGGAVVVAMGDALPATAVSALEAMRPRLLAVAGGEAVVEAVLAAVRDRLEGTGFVALEPGLALEV